MGSVTLGHHSVLLVGSSAVTHWLVSGGSAALGGGAAFPLARGSPDLNGDKFARLDVPSALCTTTAEVADMIAALAGFAAHDIPDNHVSTARLVASFVLFVCPVKVCPGGVLKRARAPRPARAATR